MAAVTTGDPSEHLEPLSCISCRARKLKCDRAKPACARCLRFNGQCVYPESRRRPASKRKNVKELEARLAQVEGILEHIGGTEAIRASLKGNGNEALPAFNPTNVTSQVPNIYKDSQLMGLGLSEALPPFELMEALNKLYFTSIYNMAPVVHAGRYLEAFYGDPLRRPPMCLQYSMWALASHGHSKYDVYTDIFYRRARNYIQADEMRDDGEHFITLAHAQSWVILAAYEAKRMLFTRASMSFSRCVRICQMMGLDRLDSEVDDLPPALGPARSWTELEERRRVFWGTFCIDCHASVSTGWPTLINTDDIMTRLPASEAAFYSGKEEKTAFLHQVFEGASYSGFAGSAVVCQIYKSVLKHVHRPKPGDNPQDMTNGGFWKRHRELDNQLSSVFLFLPEKLQLPAHIRDARAVHVNINLHASAIRLHYAAVEVAEKYSHSHSIIEASKSCMRASAEEVVSIVKMMAYKANMFKSPMCAIALYCAATVYIYMAKKDPAGAMDPVAMANLETIVHAMEAIGRTHKITQAFLQQACRDVDGNGLGSKINLPALDRYRHVALHDIVNIPLFARNSMSCDAEILPVLPGRLPLDSSSSSNSNNSNNSNSNSNNSNNSNSNSSSNNNNNSNSPQDIKSINSCNRPNITQQTTTQTPIFTASPQTPGQVPQPSNHNKRKRIYSSPNPPAVVPSSVSPVPPTNLWEAGHQDLGSTFLLPDRTWPPLSSPAFRSGTVDGLHFSTAQPDSADTAPYSLHSTSDHRAHLPVLPDHLERQSWPDDNDLFTAQMVGAAALTGGELVGMAWDSFHGDTSFTIPS